MAKSHSQGQPIRAYGRTKARRRGLALQQPCPKPSRGLTDRDKWLAEVKAGFVHPSKANCEHYAAILETLWPRGHGIPGPIVTENDLREAINKKSGKTYLDPFRRFRELQGEEGVTGIARKGKQCQLVDISLAKKRKPRTRLKDADWLIVVSNHAHKCAVCGRKEPDVRFQQDHKIPRLREGSDNLENWQPLCDECNNFKSMSCRDCSLDCSTCGWAFPDQYKPFRLSGDLIASVRSRATSQGLDADQLASVLLRKGLEMLR
jgi:hypothetical protein